MNVFIDNFTREAFNVLSVKRSLKLRISKIMSPFRTKQLQYLKGPLPRPKRTSFGFFVMGVLGKILKDIRSVTKNTSQIIFIRRIIRIIETTFIRISTSTLIKDRSCS